MKFSIKSIALMATLMSLSMATVGCGGGSSTGGPGVPGGPGIANPAVIGVGGGGFQISFTGTGVYDSGVRIKASTEPTFNSNGYPFPYVIPDTWYPYASTITLGGAPIVGGAPNVYSQTLGQFNDPGTRVTIAATPTPTQANPLLATVTGTVVVSPTYVQQNGPFGTPIGLTFDVYPKSGNTLSGTVWICETRDATGCHGHFIQF